MFLSIPEKVNFSFPSQFHLRWNSSVRNSFLDPKTEIPNAIGIYITFPSSTLDFFLLLISLKNELSPRPTFPSAAPGKRYTSPPPPCHSLSTRGTNPALLPSRRFFPLLIRGWRRFSPNELPVCVWCFRVFIAARSRGVPSVGRVCSRGRQRVVKDHASHHTRLRLPQNKKDALFNIAILFR